MRRWQVGLLVGALGAALAARLLQARARTSVVVGARRRAARNLHIARLGARSSRRWATHRARRVFADAARKDELDTEFEMRTAEDVAASLGNLKGALMKIGQMASYLDAGLPENVRLVLTQLQQDAPPMSAELAAGVVSEELGARPEELFAEWDPVPIAAASIGQVHRAITRPGRAVAVKVQYPGVAEAIEADLANSEALFGAMGLFFKGLESAPIVDELRSRLIEELDYELEARNQQEFADYFAGHPYITVPQVLPELSTGRVLTSELMTGARFSEIRHWSAAERNLAAETLYRFSFGAIYRLSAFNGDPHPGNYLFAPGGRVTFLDFGLVKRFVPAETELFQRLIKAMVVDRDHRAFRRIIEANGFLRPGLDLSDERIGEYFEHFYEFVLRDEVVTFDEAYAAAGIQQVFNASGPDADLIARLNVPPSFVILQRINLGLISLFADLRATANWRAIAEELWPFVEAPPSTPMGREIAAWRRSRGEVPAGL